MSKKHSSMKFIAITAVFQEMAGTSTMYRQKFSSMSQSQFSINPLGAKKKRKF